MPCPTCKTAWSTIYWDKDAQLEVWHCTHCGTLDIVKPHHRQIQVPAMAKTVADLLEAGNAILAADDFKAMEDAEALLAAAIHKLTKG